MKRKPNLSLRYVPGGMVRRIWTGDCWRWEVFDPQGKRLPFLAKTLKEAVKRLEKQDG